MKKVVFNVDCTETPTSRSGVNVNKGFLVCNFLHKNRQILTSTLHHCFLVNQYFQSLLHAQTRDFQFSFAEHCKEVVNVDRKSKFCHTLAEKFQL